jgi:predicted ATP-grasp superfamily ATP-dependent carboligase
MKKITMLPRTGHKNCPYIEDVARLNADVSTLKDTSSRIEKKIDKLAEDIPKNFASNERVAMIEKVLYGLIGTFLLAALAFAIKQIFGW